MAFGVDPHRRERYSLRQARYDSLAEDISRWAGDAAQGGETLSVLNVGCVSGLPLRHLEAKPHFNNIAISATDLRDQHPYKRHVYQTFILGDLTDGYPDIP
jgi:acetoin utilization deacetylase AcuC-like enzyme